ncbi:hypothetical protein ACFE04_013995 [Oxalis oulophora]
MGADAASNGVSTNGDSNKGPKSKKAVPKTKKEAPANLKGKKEAPANPKGKKEAPANPKGKKRNVMQTEANGGEPAAGGTGKRPKRAAACSDFKEKSVRFSEKSDLVASKKDAPVVEEELAAIALTVGEVTERPNRRLIDFILHDADGVPKPLEMMEVDDLFISGVILPLEPSTDKDKEKGVRCHGFGRIETWDISGYEDGSPVIWLSTEIADYDCLKPATTYKKFYDHFFEKSHACIEVYKKLSKTSGGNPDCALDELLAGVVRSMSGTKCFNNGGSIREFVLSQGEFIYNQLIGLDRIFLDVPVLAALKDESMKHQNYSQAINGSSGGNLTIKDSGSVKCKAQEDEDAKVARLLQEEEQWRSLNQKRGRGPASGSNKFYIKINEDEIANDYPLPAYYKSTMEETDELILFESDFGMSHPDDLPRSMLHNWSLYNSDSRLISLELLPMKPCADIDVTIFGSGIMTGEDTEFNIGNEVNQSSSSGPKELDGIPIYLSAIKEWMIEFGAGSVFVFIRTDVAWYRLGKPSKKYSPWFETVLKTAQVALGIVTFLSEQSRVSRVSFAEVIRRVAEFRRDDHAYISSDPSVAERFIVVHGQIILQLFAEYPDETIKKSPFITGLTTKMEERHHTKWLVKKKNIPIKAEPNMNPRAAMSSVVSKRKAMQATATRLISRIWGEYYSNYSPEDSKEGKAVEPKEDEAEDENDIEEEEEADDEVDENLPPLEDMNNSGSASKHIKSHSTTEIRWEGQSVGKMCSGELLYQKVIVRGDRIAVGDCISVEYDEATELPDIYFVEYIYEKLNGKKMFHGRLMKHGSQTVLGNTANERELFLTHDCIDLELSDVKQSVSCSIQARPWGHQYRKDNESAVKADRARAEERKKKGLPTEYYSKSLYWPEKGAFFSLPRNAMGLGCGSCQSCEIKKTEEDKEIFKMDSSKTSFVYEGSKYSLFDFVYIGPHHFSWEKVGNEIFKAGRNVGLKAYVICQILEIVVDGPKKATANSAEIKLRRFFRPENISSEKAHASDIREVYYSEETHVLSIDAIEGKCEVRKKNDVPPCIAPTNFQHIFFCERFYDPSKGSIKQLPSNIKIRYSTSETQSDVAARKKKGKSKEVESDMENNKQTDTRLATLDIFSGCGGLSEGLHQAGVSLTKWAIEYEEPAGEAFKLNHPESLVFINNCNVILRAVMERGGDLDDCISTQEAADLAAKLDESERNNLPLPGQVDFINGGPPCQGFSGMNRFNQSTWSKVQCEMILAFLSFADYFRPRYFLLENVRNFVSFNKGQTFRLTLASLLEMGYQVRFGILEAGAFGVSQSRKRAFIWAACPEDTLPDWPEPMHVFAAPELKIALAGNKHYSAVRSTQTGAPFRAITVRDTIGDLPAVSNGASKTNLEYENEPVSWFQKKIRAEMMVLTDHISKEMNELNLIRCKRIPKRPGADWRDLPKETVKLSNGQTVDLIPWCLPNTAERHNSWKGLFGRLDWEGNFPTSITDPQPMGKVGMCFHPDQDRILTVRECARSQGFPDSYKFSGNIHNKHRQIGNAVPPPLAYALGRKLKEALDIKKPTADDE